MPRRPSAASLALGTAVVALLALAGGARANEGSTSLGKAPARDKPARAVVERVAWESFEGKQRLVIGVRGVVDYTARAAGADGASNLPDRAYVDLRPAVLARDLPRAPLPVDDPLAQRVRIGQFDVDTVRIVVDLSGPGMFEVRTSERPPRLLLSLVPRPPREVAPVVRAPGPGASPAAPAAAVAGAPAEARVAEAAPPTATAQLVARVEPTPTEVVRTPPPTAVLRTPPPTAAPSPAPTASPVARATLAAPVATAQAEPPPVVAQREHPASEPAAGAAAAVTPHEAPAKVAAAPDAAPAKVAAEPDAAPSPRRTPQAKVAGKAHPPTPQVWTVVIDPGHGGRDPGARGVTGSDEKDITLAIAQLVAERLADDGQIRVVLTRTDDSYVSLEQRTAIANAQGADLFLSIHGNASENAQLAGVETYTLNNTDDRATIRLAALENGLALTGAAPGERDLAYILSDLVQTGKEDESVTLARAVQGNLVSYLRDRWRGVVNLGVKKGPFYVLVGAYMPCILVEVAFLTNETEGQRIAARRYQQDVADGIALGVRRFLASESANANL